MVVGKVIGVVVGVGAAIGVAVGVAVAVDVGDDIGVAVGDAVPDGDEVGLGDAEPVNCVHTASSGFTELSLATAVTGGSSKNGTLSPPLIMATVPVGDT